MQNVEFKVQYKNENKIVIVIVTLIWWIRSTPVNLDLIYIFTLFLWRISYEYTLSSPPLCLDSFANEIKDLKYELSSFNNIEEQSVWTNKHAPKIHFIRKLFLWRISYEYIDSFANEIKDLKYELSSFNNIEEQSVWTNKHAPKIHFIRKFEEEQTNKLEMKEMSIQYGLESISC